MTEEEKARIEKPSNLERVFLLTPIALVCLGAVLEPFFGHIGSLNYFYVAAAVSAPFSELYFIATQH